MDWIKTETLAPISMLGAVCVIGEAIIAVFFAKKEDEARKSLDYNSTTETCIFLVIRIYMQGS
jgi:hypothetical protein